jgi:putative sterol carrier protein
MSGRLAVNAQGKPVGNIEVHEGRVTVSYQTGDATAVANVDDREDFLSIIRGQLNPVVAAIQGRLTLEGDPEFAIEVILAQNATKPFGTEPASSGKGA